MIIMRFAENVLGLIYIDTYLFWGLVGVGGGGGYMVRLHFFLLLFIETKKVH